MDESTAPFPGTAATGLANPWQQLRQHTSARIALGRSGGSLPTAELLRFQLDHAVAREAVHATFDAENLATQLRGLHPDVRVLASRASDRSSYLQRPDLGRKLDVASFAELEFWHRANSGTSSDELPHPSQRCLPVPNRLLVIVSDGLAAPAANAQVATLLETLLSQLRRANFVLAPLCVIPRARVGIINDAGSAVRAEIALILLGERPGLGSNDSLGAYFGYAPGPGRTDADRNCLSNIRPAGLAPALAAEVIGRQLVQARRLRLSGSGLATFHPPEALDDSNVP